MALRPKPKEPERARVDLDQNREYRMNRVVEMLNEAPELGLATMTDDESVPGTVIVTIARRGVAVGEMEIPAEKYDPFLLMDILARHGGGKR